MSGGLDVRVRVTAIEPVAAAVKRFRLVAAGDAPLPRFSGGAHVVVSLDDGTRRIRNPYSLSGSPADGSAYEISVLRAAESRGGSAFLHERVAVGDELVVSPPVNLFPVDRRARKHLLIAGGIGVTPFVAMAAQLAGEGARFELHYAMRDAASGAYAAALAAAHPGRVRLYRSALGERIDLDGLVANQPLGTHLYVCGPERMIEGVLGAGREAGWPEASLHAERFLAPPGGDPFEVALSRSGKRLRVGEHESLLEALEAAGVDAPYLCRGGACGECQTRVVARDGTLVHNDHFLTPQQMAAGETIMICVSRLQGRELVLDL